MVIIYLKTGIEPTAVMLCLLNVPQIMDIVAHNVHSKPLENHFPYSV